MTESQSDAVVVHAHARRWAQLSLATRLAIIGIVGAIGLFAVGKFVGRATEGAPEFGPRGSSRSTAEDGAAALRELLGRYGVDTREQVGEIELGELDPSTTFVMLDPDPVADSTVRALSIFVGRGGRLVTGGFRPDWLKGITDDIPVWDNTAPPVRATVRNDQFRVSSDDSGSWVRPRLLVVRRVVGEGEVRAIANTSPLHNSRLDRADNAALGVALVGTDRTAVFAEGVHGFGRRSGAAAIPSRWKAALVLGSLAVLLTALAMGRRLGPPERIARPLPPPRAAYVDAVAEVLRRSKRPQEALQSMQTTLRSRLAARAGLPPPTSDGVDGPVRSELDALVAAAERLGWAPAEIAAVRDPVTDDDSVLRLGHALVRVESSSGPPT